MKKSRHTRRLGRIAIAFILTSVMALSSIAAFAAEVGDTINYSSRNGSPRFFSSGGWKGGCAEYGVEAASSGTARVTATYANNSDIAKLLYYYGEQQNWFDNEDPAISGWATTKHEMLNHLMRIKSMGYSAWAAALENPDAAREIYDTFYARASSLPDAPEDFEVIYCDAGTNQNFMLYRINPTPQTGNVKLKKVSANTGITG